MNRYDEQNIKYTAMIPSDYVEELKSLAASHAIPSVNQGIRLAIAKFIDEQKKIAYERQLKEAAEDESFIKRTMDCQNDFSEIDGDELLW